MKELIKLKEIRTVNKLTGSEMAKKVGVCRAQYYHIETGKRSLSYSMAIKIAKVLNRKPDELFYDDLS